MRRCINPTREARNNANTLSRQLLRKLSRKPACGRRSIARADKGNCGTVKQSQIAFDNQCGRRSVKFGKKGRIETLAEKQVSRAKTINRLNLAGDIIERRQDRRPAPATRRKHRNGFKRRTSAAKALKQLEICDRTDIRGTDQSEPVKPILIG
jgi:hypothetical protein